MENVNRGASDQDKAQIGVAGGYQSGGTFSRTRTANSDPDRMEQNYDVRIAATRILEDQGAISITGAIISGGASGSLR